MMSRLFVIQSVRLSSAYWEIQPVLNIGCLFALNRKRWTKLRNKNNRRKGLMMPISEIKVRMLAVWSKWMEIMPAVDCVPARIRMGAATLDPCISFLMRQWGEHLGCHGVGSLWIHTWMMQLVGSIDVQVHPTGAHQCLSGDDIHKVYLYYLFIVGCLALVTPNHQFEHRGCP